jgi:hypothetical protein
MPKTEINFPARPFVSPTLIVAFPVFGGVSDLGTTATSSLDKPSSSSHLQRHSDRSNQHGLMDSDPTKRMQTILYLIGPSPNFKCSTKF